MAKKGCTPALFFIIKIFKNNKLKIKCAKNDIKPAQIAPPWTNNDKKIHAFYSRFVYKIFLKQKENNQKLLAI